MTTSGTRTRIPYGKLLVVEDEDAVFRCLERIVARYRPVKHAKTFEQAVAEIQGRGRFCGFLFDQNLGDRSEGGTELLALVHREHAGTPAALVTGHIDAAIVNRVAALGAIILSKPVDERALGPFFQRVVARDHGFAKDFAERLDAVSRDFQFSPREHENLRVVRRRRDARGLSRVQRSGRYDVQDAREAHSCEELDFEPGRGREPDAASCRRPQLAWRDPERARPAGRARQSWAGRANLARLTFRTR